MIYAALATAAIMAIYLWQDGLRECPDGRRYTSGKPQPYPFHRRFCAWPTPVLIAVSLASMLALGTLMGSWTKALLFITLPGAWLVVTRPTTVDAPAMLLSFGAAALFPTYPWFAVLLSCLAGFVHERGPVFAALYAWHPLLLVGLVCAGWWRKAAPPDSDHRVGHGLLKSLASHKTDHDWLDLEATLFAARGLPFFAIAYGTSPAAWLTLGLSWAQRVICTDLGRLVLWAAPVMIRDMPEVPAWLVLAHVVTFRRMG